MADISLIPKTQKQRGLPHFASFKEPSEKLPTPVRILALVWGVTILFSVGLFVWQWSLRGTHEALSRELLSVQQARDIERENRVQRLSEELSSFETLLSEHRNWTRLFELVEERTVRSVAFNELEADFAARTLALSGTAPTYNALAQQIKSFERDEGIQKVDVSDITLNEDGRVEFRLVLAFDPGILIGIPETTSP